MSPITTSHRMLSSDVRQKLTRILFHKSLLPLLRQQARQYFARGMARRFKLANPIANLSFGRDRHGARCIPDDQFILTAYGLSRRRVNKDDYAERIAVLARAFRNERSQKETSFLQAHSFRQQPGQHEEIGIRIIIKLVAAAFRVFYDGPTNTFFGRQAGEGDMLNRSFFKPYTVRGRYYHA